VEAAEALAWPTQNSRQLASHRTAIGMAKNGCLLLCQYNILTM
jgi:hypothetical protein